MRARIWAVALALVCAGGAAHAQGYPARAIRLIVPFPPGGPNDVLGRVVAQKLTEQMGQQVVVDNRGGAGGIIGAELAARANPDGHTLLFGGTASMSINPILHKKLGYDPVWWGIINVVVIELGMIIPPIGVIVFLLHGLAPDIPMRTIYRGVAPFIAADLLLLALLAVFPAISLWLPAYLAR